MRKSGAILILTATLLAAGASAQETQRGQKADHVSQAQAAPPAGTRTFNIPPQPLETAVTAFGRQAGVQVSIETSVARGVQTGGVTGTMSTFQALNQLLAGTGIVARFVSDREVMLTSAQGSGPPGSMQLDPIQVQGMFPVPQQALIDNLPPPYAGGQVATGGQLGLLGNRAVMDTPFNQTNYTSKNVQDQQARSVREALIDDPSVRVARPETGPGSDGFFVRGFLVNNEDLAYGGVYGMLPGNTVVAQIAERIEVLKGPSALLSGIPPQSSIGGVINIVPKRAPENDLTQATASYVSAGNFGGHVDFARRFGEDKQFGVRINGVFNGGQTYIENNTNQLGLGTVNLDFRGERVRLAVDAGYQGQYLLGLQPNIGLANGVPLPSAPDARKNLGQPWGYQQRNDLFGVVRGEVDLTENVTAYATYGAHENRWTGLYSATLNVTNLYGAGTGQAPSSRNRYESYWTWQAGVRANVDTGPVGHEIAVNYTNYKNVSGNGSVTGTAFATNLYNPTIIAQPNLPIPGSFKQSSAEQSGFAVADTLSAANKRVQLTVGARYQSVGATNYNTTTGVPTSNYLAEAVSPAVGLVVKPFWENVSFYGNYIQGLQPGTVVGPTFTNAGEVFPPFKSTQYEAGVKVDWGKLTTTVSLFQINQPSILTNVTTNTQILGGEQVNQGLEVNVFGEPMEGVRLLGGVMFLNAVLAKTQGGLTDGWVAPFSPGFNLNLAGEWDLPFVRGLTLNGRVVYTGSQYIDTTFPRRSLPEWTRFDLGVRYAFENPGAKDKLLVARFNVDNVLDANYWAGGSGATVLMLGAPRTFRLSLTADF